MKRATAVLGLALAMDGRGTVTTDDLLRRVIEFHRHYNVFSRALLGCPKQAREVEECIVAQGTIDYGEYLKARKAAMKAFDLHE